MFKKFFVAVFALLAATSCTNESELTVVENNETVPATVPDGSPLGIDTEVCQDLYYRMRKV